MGETSDFGDNPFELTGDSELDARSYEQGIVALEEDDAVSYCYEDLGSEGERSWKHDFKDDDEDSLGGEGDEENLRRKDGGGGGVEFYDESCILAESNGDEMERNRLFWEACLAS